MFHERSEILEELMEKKLYTLKMNWLVHTHQMEGHRLPK
jgi:hypothetical protein